MAKYIFAEIFADDASHIWLFTFENSDDLFIDGFSFSMTENVNRDGVGYEHVFW